MDEGLTAAAGLRARGIDATLDLLGEATESEDDARRAARGYVEVLNGIFHRGLRSHVSLKLSQMGLDLSEDLAAELLGLICRTQLLPYGNAPALATHDERLIRRARDFAASRGLAKDRFEFQFFYGIRRDLQERLVADGYRVRVYVPFGTHWYPYFLLRCLRYDANAWAIRCPCAAAAPLATAATFGSTS